MCCCESVPKLTYNGFNKHGIRASEIIYLSMYFYVNNFVLCVKLPILIEHSSDKGQYLVFQPITGRLIIDFLSTRKSLGRPNTKIKM